MSMNKIKGGVKSVRGTLASQLEENRATPETTDSPFGLYLYLMYRDGSNFKTCRSVLMTNRLGITKETIEQAIAIVISDVFALAGVTSLPSGGASVSRDVFPTVATTRPAKKRADHER